MLAKYALLSYSNGDDSKMVLFVKIGPRVAEFLALQTDRDSRLLITIYSKTLKNRNDSEKHEYRKK